ncbi:MAG: 50S ribosomal protein L23 [Nitrospirota bacterium]|jgi:large subunit ribosomal protein L23
MSHPYDILIRPSITEKSVRLREDSHTVVFEVDKKSTKQEIKRAVEEALSVKVARVSTLLMKGKKKRHGRAVGFRPDRKKAFVTLEPGQKIDLFEGK